MRSWACFALVLCACSLDENGLLPPSSQVDGGADATPDVVDAAIDVPPVPCSTPPGACVAAVPPGWSLVAFDATGKNACPGNFTSAPVVSSPTPQAGACDCSCTVTTVPACDIGALQRFVSNDSSCGTTGVALNVNGPGCTAYPNTVLDSHSKSSPIGPTNGACVGNAVSNISAVTVTTESSCVVPASCEEEFCEGTALPAGFARCIVAAGQQTCPSNWPTSTVVGDAPTLQCSACACDVNGPSTCTNASLDIFSDTGCTTSLVTMPVDSQCDIDSAAGSTPRAFEYHATLTQVCNAAGPKTATVGVTNQRTICCK